MADAREPQDTNKAIERVDELGTATEHFFSRLYQNLRHRPASPARASKKDQRQEAERIRLAVERSKQLSKDVKRKEQDIERLQAILANIDEGVIMQDNNGRVVMFNAAAKEMLGNQKNFWDSDLGRMFESQSAVKNLDSELVPLGKPLKVQVNSRNLSAQIAAVADSKGRRLGTMVLLRDVSSQAVAEHLKDQFITAISHELRTPMTVIKGASEVLAGGEPEQPVNRKILDTLIRNVDLLDRMVVELLDISEISAGRFSVRQEPVQLEPLLWSVLLSMAAEIKKAGLEVNMMMRNSEKLIVNGDEQRLRWAFGHLLQNSIHYTERGGSVTIAAGLDEDNSNFIAVDIIDNGVGISEKDLPNIFNQFYRGQPRNRSGKLLDPRGLGQGLFVARTVAQGHGGYLTVQSVQGQGSVFTMILPRKPD
jgi:two-component system phosphate regulon sensor histidine kinase PhoR